MNGINNSNNIYYSAMPTVLNPQAGNTGYYIPNKYDTVSIKNKEKNQKDTWFMPAVIVLSALAGTAGLELLLRKTTNKGILEHIGEVFKSSKKPKPKYKPKYKSAPVADSTTTPKPKSNPATVPAPRPAPIPSPVPAPVPTATTLASKEDLLGIFNIPYSFNVHSENGVRSNVPAEDLKLTKVMAIGDLHASSRKLFETLIAGDFITMDEATAKALNTKLLELEKPENNSPASLRSIGSEINTLIQEIQWKPEAKDKQLILIGNVLADRGPLDTVTLDLVEHLTKDSNDNRIVRIVGDHDHEAYLRALESLKNDNVIRRKILNNKCTSSVNTSIRRFDPNKTVKLDEEELKELQTKYFNYLSKAKLMHYDEETKTLYCHAPITTKEINALVNIIKTQLKIKEPKLDLPNLAEQANQLYNNYVTNRRYDEDIEEFFEVPFSTDHQAGFLCSRPRNIDGDTFPFKEVKLVHGHDMEAEYSETSKPKKTVNLDNLVRKGEEKMADSLPIYVS